MDLFNYSVASIFIIVLVALIVTHRKRYHKELKTPIVLTYEGDFDLDKLLSIIRIHHFDNSDRWLSPSDEVKSAGFGLPTEGYPVVKLQRIEATRMSCLYEGTVQLEYIVDGTKNVCTFNTVGAHIKI